MRKPWMALALGAILGGQGWAVTDLIPTALNVVLVDSTSDPDQDSVRISMEFTVKGGAAKPQDQWVVNEVSLDGVLRLNGVVDSAQTLNAGVGYSNTIGAWVDKKPFSAAGFMDPAGVSGETAKEAQNNLIVRKFNFHPGKVRLDTAYTGKNCEGGIGGGQ